VLGEAAALSENLSQLAAAGLEALQFIHSHTKASAEWLGQKQSIITKARQQGGRCEIQVVDPVARLIEKAGE